tara:strand:+ start:399 stop:1139 length:741 start_codon:yes stop_codon:yes gene_type:complete
MSLGLGNSLTSNLYSSSEVSYSMSFDGTGDFLDFTETTFDIAGTGEELTIAFWAKRTDNNDEAVVLGNSGSGSFKRMNFDSDGDALLIESDQNAQIATGTVTADTNWHHYVITVVGNGGGGAAAVVMYEDGSAVTTSAGNFGVTNDKDFTVNRIGDDNALGNQAFKGLLYQLAIWTDKLEANEVSAIYNSGSPIDIEENSGNYTSSSELVHLWDFREGSGSTAADQVGSLNATLNGNAAFSTTIPS